MEPNEQNRRGRGPAGHDLDGNKCFSSRRPWDGRCATPSGLGDRHRQTRPETTLSSSGAAPGEKVRGAAVSEAREPVAFAERPGADGHPRPPRRPEDGLS